MTRPGARRSRRRARRGPGGEAGGGAPPRPGWWPPGPGRDPGREAPALADRPSPADPAALVDHHDLDAVLCLGDLQPSWMERLDRVKVPKVGVRGNHDAEPYMEQFGIEDVHLRRIELDGGLT